MCRVVSICGFRRVCGIVSADKKQAAVGVGSAVRLNNRLAKEPCMSSIQLTMPRAWWQEMYVSCYAAVSVFCGIMGDVRPTSYKTTPQGADNTERGLTIVYTGGRANGYA